jgi:asparaginyl-tRNA synthetase
MVALYIDEDKGVDAPETQGTEASPFKSLIHAYVEKGGADNEYHVKKAGEDEYKPATKSALKKAANYLVTVNKKNAAASQRADKEAQDKIALDAAIEAAKNIKITEDPTLEKALLVSVGETDAKIIGKLRKNEKEPAEGVKRIRVQGRVYRVAKQGGLTFVTLRRGLDLIQILFAGNLAKTYDILTLARETSLEVSGELFEVPAGAHAPLNRELHADYFRIIAKAPGGDDAFVNRVPENAELGSLLDLRYLDLRNDKPTAVMYVRSILEEAFHTAYKELDIKKVSPPALVQSMVEGGSTLFSFDYYKETAFLTQSSQLYLETVLPSLGDVYCIEKSFRAEKSLTRRHLSEYTHIEAELDFITFNDLLDHLEHIICRVINLILADPVAAKLIQKYNPDFKPPAQPFLRMRYTEAIDWLREKGIKNEEGNDHTFGDDM